MDQTVHILKALAEPTRLRIVAICREAGDLTVSELVRILGQSQPRVSRHLRLLTEAGVLLRIPEGSWVFYRIASDVGITRIIEAVLASVPTNDVTRTRDRERLRQVQSDRADAAQRYFDANAAAWSEIRALHVDQDQVNAALKDFLTTESALTLLDIGTGTGEMLQLFADRISRGEGVDLSHEMLSMARAELDRAGISHCQVRHGDIYSLPFDADSFDVVVIHQVLHFVDDPFGAVGEAARVLAPGGRLLIADFAPHDVEELRDTHQHRRLGFVDEEITDALTAVGMKAEGVTKLPGEPLTVSIWNGFKPAANSQEAAE